jgi:predicted signal transduction protein with EAL and GGDEF domain
MVLFFMATGNCLVTAIAMNQLLVAKDITTLFLQICYCRFTCAATAQQLFFNLFTS